LAIQNRIQQGRSLAQVLQRSEFIAELEQPKHIPTHLQPGLGDCRQRCEGADTRLSEAELPALEPKAVVPCHIKRVDGRRFFHARVK
jgi:hypothetical protein